MRIRRAWLPGVLCGALLTATADRALAGGGGGLVVSQELKLAAADAGPGDEFGYAVDVDGATAIVGAPLENGQTGAVYVFVRAGDQWVQQAKLVAYDGLAGDRFGWAVAVSGDSAIVGAHLKDDGAVDAGAAYAFVRTGTEWTAATKLPRASLRTSGQENFGVAVDIEGDRALVAAYLDDLDPEDEIVLPVGSVTVYERLAGVWVEGELLVASDGAPNDRFGRSVALSGATAIVGAYQDDDAGSASGSTYVFERIGSTWSEVTKLVPDDLATGDWFGYSVSLSGDRALIGAPLADRVGENSGSAYAFVRTGTSWTQEALVVHEGLQPADEYGFSTALAGGLGIVGARHDLHGESTTGSAHVFRSPTGSVAGGPSSLWEAQLTLLAADAEPDDEFGYAVATDGLNVMVGSRFEDEGGAAAGAVYSYLVTAPPYVSFCPEDGSTCPCGNTALDAHGCDNSGGTGGVGLSATQFLPNGQGRGSVVLVGRGFQPGSPTALAIRSRTPDTIGKPFGDGLLCLVFPIRRLEARVVANGSVTIPLLHKAGADTFYYQLWYRNQASFCTGAPFNVSNGISIAWP